MHSISTIRVWRPGGFRLNNKGMPKEYPAILRPRGILIIKCLKYGGKSVHLKYQTLCSINNYKLHSLELYKSELGMNPFLHNEIYSTVGATWRYSLH